MVAVRGLVPVAAVLPFFFLFFFFLFFPRACTFPASEHAVVVTGVIPSSPPVRAFDFYRA